MHMNEGIQKRRISKNGSIEVKAFFFSIFLVFFYHIQVDIIEYDACILAAKLQRVKKIS